MVGKGGAAATNGGSYRERLSKPLNVDAAAAEAESDVRKNDKGGGDATPQTAASTPSSAENSPDSNGGKTPAGVRGRGDLRSPGVKKSPATVPPQDGDDQYENEPPLPDFITQTDKYGRAVTPRSASAISSAQKGHPSGPLPHVHVRADGKPVDDEGHVLSSGHPPCASHAADDESGDSHEKPDGMEVDACDALLESLRMMCCCLLPEDQQGAAKAAAAAAAGTGAVDSKTVDQSATVASGGTDATSNTADDGKGNCTTREAVDPTILPEDTEDDLDRVRLLPKHHPDDVGKKCLVLDLDETLVHSSFRAVPGADFVIPVQIEDVVHFVYVMKRPGVDEFLVEMAKHYEVVIYTASLNKYADPLLDLLDPHRTIRTRLFRESCVYYEGNYVKDMSLIDRDLSQAIIVDNSPSSYMFHPENAIDCSSFIDDPNDRELDQIGSFLVGIRDVPDVRHVCNLWRDYPNIPRVPGLIMEGEESEEEQR